MSRMIRKQVYLAPEQQRKLRVLAARWGRAESDVLRVAIDRLPDPESSVDERLLEAGLLMPPSPDDDVPEGEALAELERVQEAWSALHPQPLGLAEAVLDDRR